MKRIFVLSAVASCLLLPGGRPHAAESLEGVEKDLTAIIREMDSIQSELDRIEDVAKAPVATSIRLEIHGDGRVTPPARVRLLVGGKVEEEREWGKAERDIFSGGSVPLVLNVPFLPGSYPARVELSNPAWKRAAGVDVPMVIEKGKTLPVRLKLSARPGKDDPSLSRLEAR
jgi:hypothetical protein